jgi:hypothetical protein
MRNAEWVGKREEEVRSKKLEGEGERDAGGGVGGFVCGRGSVVCRAAAAADSHGGMWKG